MFQLQNKGEFEDTHFETIEDLWWGCDTADISDSDKVQY